MTSSEGHTWLRVLSDQALLVSLRGSLGAARRSVADVVAHLTEIEERRLHLIAGYGSMFAYCTDRLGMSEDEACRRIDVARLARRFPVVFEHLADGRISLSVAASLKHRMTEANHVELLADVSGKTVAQAREVLAAWFPQADVPPTIRKLPEHGPRTRSSASGSSSSGGAGIFESTTSGPREPPPATASGPAAEISPPVHPSAVHPSAVHPSAVPTADRTSSEHTSSEPTSSEVPDVSGGRARSSEDARPSSRTSPLSLGRFKVTFTADAALKQKIELARDLLRHAVPHGDLAAIFGRALDLLIEKTEKRRFGRTDKINVSAPTQTPNQPEAQASSRRCSAATTPGCSSGAARYRCHSPSPIAAAQPAERARSASPPSRYLPANVRRAVSERDGLRCSWRGPDGTRCNSRAWLEYDHIIPRAQGGTNDPENIHPYCRAHNRFAAEQTYGQATIARIIARRRAVRDRVSSPSRPGSIGSAPKRGRP